MQIRCLFTSLLLLIVFIVRAQDPYYNKRPDFLKSNSVWAFGLGAGLDFNGLGGPLPINTKQHAEEGASSVSNPVTGQLLFYSHGGKVWNAQHSVMPNGDSLLGNCSRSYLFGQLDKEVATSVQGTCIVPVINSPGKYYLFSLSGETSGGQKMYDTAEDGSPLVASLFYNVIDMSLDSGRGDIVPGMKNIPLDEDVLSEAMVAIPGENCDVWLIIHPTYTTEFRAYHITESGIDKVPIASTTGDQPTYDVGSIAISSDRKKIAIATFSFGAGSGVIELGAFNSATGKINIDMNFHKGPTYNLCFSPDGSKLYTSGFYEGIHQFDLQVYDSMKIVTSRHNLKNGSLPGCLRLYNDTIYFATTVPGKSIGRINKPNAKGALCDFQSNVIQVLPGDTVYHTLGSDVVSALPHAIQGSLILDTILCAGTLFSISAPDGFEGRIWEDGSVDAVRTIDKPGKYWVYSKDFCDPRVDTFIVAFSDVPTPIINVNERILGTTIDYATYRWLLNGKIIEGATAKNYKALENGDYQVIVSTKEGCVDTSAVYEVTNVDDTGIPVKPLGYNIDVYPNPVTDLLHIQGAEPGFIYIHTIDGRLQLMAENQEAISLKALSSGIYLVRLQDKAGHLLKVIRIVKK